ncbi:odorant receptor 82a-like [Prorops nasuta]|uniref:odorant receptor 82a-like n=1 Tax=Prorops nasuta TaxID=863751 RepID=UPI0034CF1322
MIAYFSKFSLITFRNIVHDRKASVVLWVFVMYEKSYLNLLQSDRISYKNIHFKTDAAYVVNIAKKLLTPIGIYPLQRGDSFWDLTRLYLQSMIIFFLMCFLLIPHVIYTFFDAENLTKYMKVIAAQVFSLLALIKFFTMIINRKKIAVCLREMENQYRNVKCEEDREVMRNSAKIGRFFTLAYLGLTYGGALPYHVIMPFVADRIVKNDNTTQIPLPYLSNYIFFEVEDSPFFEMMFFLQIFISIIILTTNCGVYSLIASCVVHSYCLFEVVNRQISIILYSKSSEKIKIRLKVIIQYHTQAILYANMIEGALHVVFLSEMVGCTIIICFLEYGVLMEWEDKKTLQTMVYFILMTSIFVNVFIMSFIGDRLKEESEKVADSIYLSDWYNLQTKLVNDLRYIMIRSRKSSRLTAGKIFNISLGGFCEVVKTSAAYFNFIRAISNKYLQAQ